MSRTSDAGILPRTPVRFGSFKVADPPAGYGTRIGEHTKEILPDLDYSASEAGEMHQQNAVKSPG